MSFIKINEENKAMATGQQFTWPHHYIQTLAPQFTWPHYYQSTIYLTTLLPANNLPGLTARLTLATQYTWPHSYRPHSLLGHTARL